jgi:hypothetical protein
MPASGMMRLQKRHSRIDRGRFVSETVESGQNLLSLDALHSHAPAVVFLGGGQIVVLFMPRLSAPMLDRCPSLDEGYSSSHRREAPLRVY